MRGGRYAKEDGDELMATNEITARVTLQGEIKANATLGVPVNVYVDREIYDGETDITPTEDDITLETAGKAVLENILVHGVPQVPHTVVASGSFVKQGTGVTYTLDTHSTKWTRLLIKPHEFPHTGMAASAVSRAIMAKFIDLELDAMITAYMSSAGTAFNAGSYKRISTGDECDVENGIVTMTGESSTTGKWINGIQYDWYAWNDGADPTEANIVEGEFIGTEEGILQVDIPYNGDTFPKMIVVYVKDEIASLTGDFIANANVYAINALQLLKMYSTTPSYNGNSNANFARLVLLYKASNSAYNQQAVSGYSYNQGSCRWNADCLKIRDNKTMDVFIKNERDPETGGIYFMQGIRYTYQVFY